MTWERVAWGLGLTAGACATAVGLIVAGIWADQNRVNHQRTPDTLTYCARCGLQVTA